MSPICTNVSKGDSSPVWLFGHLDANGVNLNLSTGYTCKMAVKGTEIARDITTLADDNLAFLVSLTAAETATLTVGEAYVVGMQLENAAYTPALVMERHERIFIIDNVVI